MNAERATDLPDGISIAGTPRYRGQHDMDRDGLCLSIAEAVAEAKGVDVTELIDDFAAYADPDALDRLFRTRPNGQPRREGEFVYLRIKGCAVVVFSDGTIEVY